MDGITANPLVQQLVNLPWVDKAGLGLVGLFLLLGIWRGLWWQVIRLLGVIGAIALARALAPRFAPTIESTFEFSPEVSHGVTWLTLFLAGLVIASLFGMVGKKALDAMQLGLVDRAGGALAGALTGAVLHAAALVGISSLASEEWSTRTLEGTRSAYLLDTLSRKAHVLMDAQAAERLAPIVRGAPKAKSDAPLEAPR